MTPESKKLGLICFASQPGSSFSTFSDEKFRNDVERPIRELLATGVLHLVVVVVMCEKHSPYAENTEERHVREEGVPAHAFSPTSDAVMRILHDECTKGRVHALNVWNVRPQDAASFAKRYLQGQGAQRVMVKFQNIGFPDAEMFVRLNEFMVCTSRDLLVFGAEEAPNSMLIHF